MCAKKNITISRDNVSPRIKLTRLKRDCPFVSLFPGFVERDKRMIPVLIPLFPYYNMCEKVVRTYTVR